jgi:hypothetical protein
MSVDTSLGEGRRTFILIERLQQWLQQAEYGQLVFSIRAMQRALDQLMDQGARLEGCLEPYLEVYHETAKYATFL